MMKAALMSEGALTIQVISEQEFLQEVDPLLSECVAVLMWGSTPFSFLKWVLCVQDKCYLFPPTWLYRTKKDQDLIVKRYQLPVIR